MKTSATQPKKILLFFASLLFMLKPFAQTGPAGVGSSSTNRVWLDANEIISPDGSPISNWEDLSGNGSNFTQITASKQPTLNSTGISGLPSVTFNGVYNVLNSGPLSGLESASLTYFIVYDRTTLTADLLIQSNYASQENKWRTYMNNSQNTIISAQYSPSIQWVRYTDPPGASFLSSHIAPTSIQTYNQGNLTMSRSAFYTVPSGHQNISLGNNKQNGFGLSRYDGEISEVIIYNTAINPLQRVLIENYLGAKYQLAVPTDLFAFETTHRFDLIGIGDDGTNTQTSARGNGELEISGATELSAGEYFIVANTGENFNLYNEENVPFDLPEHQRLERTWRLDETGDAGVVTLTFHMGDFDFGTPDSYRLLVDSDDDFTEVTVAVAGTYDALNKTVSFNVNMEDGSYFTLAGINEILEIHSITDGLWSETSTWDCGCIPGPFDIVHIDPSTEVTVDVNAAVDDLFIQFSGNLIMNTDVTLDINGDWQTSGLTNFTNGTISLTGSEPQTVSIVTTSAYTLELYNVFINNTSGGTVTFSERTFELYGTLSPERGDIVVTPSTEFIVMSTSATEGGRIGAIQSPSSITGTFSVQRNIPAGPADWRNLCSPVNGSTFLDWDPDLSMSGPGFPDGCAFGPDGCFYSVTYTENGTLHKVSNGSSEILNRRGYEVYVGTDTVSFDGTTITSTGTLNPRGDITKTINTGWSTIGNPYASPIAYNSISRTSNISKYYYVYDAASGSYAWYDEESGTSSIPEITSNGLMATGQAVWVTSSGAGTLTFNQSNKVENATFIRASESGSNSLEIMVKSNSSTYRNSIFLSTDMAEATDQNDEGIDIKHLVTNRTPGPSLAMQFGDDLIRKNYIKDDARDKSFPLNFATPTNDYFTVSAENWAYFTAYRKILIVDHENGAVQNLKEAPYTFYAEACSDSIASTSRFTLILSNEETGDNDAVVISDKDEQDGIIQVKQMGHMLDLQVEEDFESPTTVMITNLLGQNQVYQSTLQVLSGSNLIYLPENLKGFYIVTLQTGNETITKKIVL